MRLFIIPQQKITQIQSIYDGDGDYPHDKRYAPIFTPQMLKTIALRKSLREDLEYTISGFKTLRDFKLSKQTIYDCLPTLDLLFYDNTPMSVQEYIQYVDYCPKFNDNFKRRVRAFYGNCCVLCGHVWQPGEDQLCVHHVYYNKRACCELLVDGRYVHTLPEGFRLVVIGDPNKFVSLCDRCHPKTNTNRLKWAKLFEEFINNECGGKSWLTRKEYEQYLRGT